MKEERAVDLQKYTTFRMGGTAKIMYTPENEEELLELYNQGKTTYCIGGGSNLIINTREFDAVVNLRQFNSTITAGEYGCFYVGASTHLQHLILTINQAGYGGIEYLFSVPGLVGGAVVMNAGRGKAYHCTIGDYIQRVKVIHNGRIEWILRDACHFSYRSSIFQSGEYLILGVEFKFPKVAPVEAEIHRKQRINLCRSRQDGSAPNFGTVFCESNKLIMQAFKYLPIGKGNGICYSTKTANWMLNKGGSFTEVMKMLDRVKRVHEIVGAACRTAVVVWE